MADFIRNCEMKIIGLHVSGLSFMLKMSHGKKKVPYGCKLVVFQHLCAVTQNAQRRCGFLSEVSFALNYCMCEQ